MPANPNHARHHVSFPPPPNLGLAASHEGQGSRQPRASEDRRTSKRSHLRCGVLEGAASLAHPRAARMCGQAGPETIRHVMFSIPACLNSLTERMSAGETGGIGHGGGTRTCSAEGGGAAGSWTDRDVDTLGGGRVRHGLQMERERGAGWMEGQNRPPAPGGGLWRPRAEPRQHWRFGESNEPCGPCSHAPGRTRARTDSGWAISSGAPALGRERSARTNPLA